MISPFSMRPEQSSSYARLSMGKLERSFLCKIFLKIGNDLTSWNASCERKKRTACKLPFLIAFCLQCDYRITTFLVTTISPTYTLTR
jgi:hypothetical protein